MASCYSTRARTVLPLALVVASLGAACSALADDPAAKETLQVAFIAGSSVAVDRSDGILAMLEEHLEQHSDVECALITRGEGEKSEKGFQETEALDEADVAVVFGNGKTLPEQDLSVLERLLQPGKGLVVVRLAGHDGADWPAFDQEVLGAVYEGASDVGHAIENIYMHPHPIFTGAEDLQIRQSISRSLELADDVHVIMQGSSVADRTPLAWTRQHRGARIFHWSAARVEDFEDPAHMRVVGNGILWAARREIPGAETAVVRTIMPDANPGSLAVVFPEGPSLCFDPVRGGINYIWEGTFIDFRPAWTEKVGKEATIRGERFYEETAEQPLRLGKPDRDVSWQFDGYRLMDGYPVFAYRLDECRVREEVRPLPDADGVVRTFRTDAPGESFWLLTGRQEGAAVCAADGERSEAGRLHVVADTQGTFRITIRKQQERQSEQ